MFSLQGGEGTVKEKEKIRNHWTLEFAKKLDALTQGMRDDLAVTPTLALDILINSALIFTKTVLKLSLIHI